MKIIYMNEKEESDRNWSKLTLGKLWRIHPSFQAAPALPTHAGPLLLLGIEFKRRDRDIYI